MALYRSPLTVTLWPSSVLKKYGPMIPPAHKAHQTLDFHAGVVLHGYWTSGGGPVGGALRLPRPIALSPQNNKPKAVKRPAAPVTKPAKSTKSKNPTDSDYVFPKKTVKNIPIAEKKEIKTNNSFEALNSDKTDVEEVTTAYKIKPIFMRIFDSYNLVLQDLHRSYPTATNTHTKGYIKIEAQTEIDHDGIIKYLKDKNIEFFVIESPLSRPLKLVIKGLPVDIDPEDIKNDLISKGIKIVKATQLKRFISKAPLPIYMIEIARDENVNDIFQVRSCLFMQIKIDPFKKGNRVTQCYNCNFFHHATSNCNMKTRCLKCGENHRTGRCEIKEKIADPLCINCNAKGHMASSSQCPLFPKPRKDSKHQMSAPGLASSASEKSKNSKNSSSYKETLNVPQNASNDFGYFQAIIEMQKIFTLFPDLLTKMEKSSKCTDPNEKLNCLLRVVCSSVNNV
ncbi:uncharacterized protein TNCV_677861 [Trichonephila clavipes]|nr:uncharacterized protein TNCV_677861 [Trichonephila clavipes]